MQSYWQASHFKIYRLSSSSNSSRSMQARLLALFEEHAPAGKGWMDKLMSDMPGYSKREISRELKAKGLKRGRLTANQVRTLLRLQDTWLS